jgi:hypothetical protein
MVVTYTMCREGSDGTCNNQCAIVMAVNVTIDLEGLNLITDIRHNRCLSEEGIAKIDRHLKKIYVSVLVGLGRKGYEASLKELRGQEYTRYREKPEKSKVAVRTQELKECTMCFMRELEWVHVAYSQRKTENVSSRNSGTHSCRCRGFKWHM